MTKERGETLCEAITAAISKHLGDVAEPWPGLSPEFRAILADAETAVRNAALEEAAIHAGKFSDDNYAAKPFTSYVEGRADAGCGIAAAIRAMKEPT